MIEKRLQKSDIDGLLNDVLFITLLAIIFLFVVAKFGGYASDYVTKVSCKAVDETYIAGKNHGDGICIKSNNNIDIKK